MKRNKTICPLPQSPVAACYIVVHSGCLHGQRAVLRKAYLERIAVILRHREAYGTRSYVSPRVSESAWHSICVHVCKYPHIWDDKHFL